MTIRMLAIALAAALLLPATPAAAQRREFLTDGEISQLREAQEPAERLKLYVEFARVRISAVEKALSEDSAGRSDLIHDNLTEYDRIIDAIDDNSDLAQKNRAIFRKGLEAALKAEPEFLKQLEGFRARNPADLPAYRFILERTIETTRDSIEGLQIVLDKQPKGRKEEREERKLREQDLKEKEAERIREQEMERRKKEEKEQKDRPAGAPTLKGPPRKTGAITGAGRWLAATRSGTLRVGQRSSAGLAG